LVIYNKNNFIGANIVLLDFDELIECHLKGCDITIKSDTRSVKVVGCYFEDTLLNVNQPNHEVYIRDNIFVNTDLTYQPFMRWLESKCPT